MKNLLRRYMGDCLIQLRRPKRINRTPVGSTCRGKVVRVVKMDGKVVEYRSPISVKDVLVDFNGFGVGIPNTCPSKTLPPNYGLETGRVYCLVPNSDQSTTKMDNKVKQIKVVITKQQLRELLSKQGSMEDMLSKVCKGLFDGTTSWRPDLETIPEGHE